MIKKTKIASFRNNSHRNFSALLQNCNELILCLDPDLSLIEFNSAAAKAHGWKREQVLGLNYMELCLKSGFTSPFPFDPNAILLGKKITDHVSRFLHSDKTEHQLSWTITRLLNDKKEPYGLLMIGNDITDVKEALAKAAHLDNIIKHAPGLIYYWKDRESVHLGCNNRFAELAGLNSCDEVVGKTDFDLPWKNQAESYRKDDRQVMTTGKPKSNIEDLLTTIDGELRIIIANKVALRDMDGKIIGTLSTAADITQLKAAEQATLEAKNRAEFANQAKSRFLATVSHELRTPMNAIMGMTQVLLRQNPRQEQQECIDIIHRSSLRLLALIDDMLDFSKLESGELEMRSKRFNLHTLVTDLITESALQLANKPIQLQVDYSDIAPKFVCLDASRVKQVLLYLLNNAIKFTHEGRITLAVHCTEQTQDTAIIRITVTDTGIGIVAEKLEQIFECFTQVESQYNRRFEGAGLGLAVSKQLTQAMHGQIGVSSTLGEGSCFWVELPSKTLLDLIETTEEKNTALDPALTEVSEFKREHPKILLVEDNILNQKVAKSILEDFGCVLDIAGTGERALQLFDENLYDLIFMDISLPDMDGLTVTRLMRQKENNKARLPILALTAHVLAEDKENCFHAGINAVITKPIMPDELKLALIEWLGTTYAKREAVTTH